MTFGLFETHAPADLKQLQELLSKATQGKWVVSDCLSGEACWCRLIDVEGSTDGLMEPFVAGSGCVSKADAALIVAMHEALPALLASHEALSAEKWEQGSLLASTTDLLNTWARESNVTEAQNEKGIRDLADRLWSKLSGELCAQRRQIAALSAEVAGLRASLGAIMKLIGDGTLVRDISGDAEPGWAMKQLPLVMALKTAQELLDAARGQEKKDDR